MTQAPKSVMALSGAVFVIALGTILVALAFEYLGGYAPCALCLEERYAYYFAIPAALAAWLAARIGAVGGARILLALVALVFLFNVGLGVYHAGIEWEWWTGPDACAGGFELAWGQGGIVETPVIRCDEASWRFLGLSFAGWNAVMSAIIAGLAIFGATRRR
jgi:disulfide bond formation protein DsbB